uniref:glycerol-3-phosphate 1-O-acyltransferase PlsY n=1 Tax=Agathobacter sp. TaxID=2021311 RepID=UPI004055E11B
MALRLIAVAIGYVFGLFQTGYIYGRTQGIDIRQHGSGNSGATNTLRTLGKKAGAIAFFGDFMKAILPVLLVKFLFADAFDGDIKVLEMYAGFGAVLGHNFPFYMKFKGGKGIASTAGVAVSVCPVTVPLCFAVFLICIKTTRYVSLGSILMAVLFFGQVVLLNANGLLGVSPEAVMEFNILTFVFSALAIYRHRANIVRLLNGTENKLGEKAKK